MLSEFTDRVFKGIAIYKLDTKIIKSADNCNFFNEKNTSQTTDYLHITILTQLSNTQIF